MTTSPRPSAETPPNSAASPATGAGAGAGAGSYAFSRFRSPKTISPLALSEAGDALIDDAGNSFPIIDGFADFVGGRSVPAQQKGEDYYRHRAAEYDRGNAVMFQMVLADEAQERRSIISELKLNSTSLVLETGCGTCRDTAHILQACAHVYSGDLSLEMLTIGRDSLAARGADQSRVTLFRADAMTLPFADQTFDAAFHFGGLNLFPDRAAALREMARVVKPGGRVVAGDEGVAPWLKETQFGRILKNSNPLFEHDAPLTAIPTSARNVACRWVLNGSFYLLSFDVGGDEPGLDLDVVFPGWRGGSHRTRYFGKLEGVSPELKEAIVERAAAEGLSVVEWLERSLRTALDGN